MRSSISPFYKNLQPVFLIVIALVLMGCGGDPSGPPQVADDDFESKITIAPNPSPTGGARADPSGVVGGVARQAEQYADQLADKLHAINKRAAADRRTALTAKAPPAIPRVQWLDDEPQSHWTPRSREQADQATSRGGAINPLNPLADRPPVAAALKKVDREQLVRRLAQRVLHSDALPIAKATTLATLSLLNRKESTDAAELKGLSPTQRRRMKRYQRLIGALYDQAVSDEGEFDLASLEKLCEKALGREDFAIRKVLLVRRVVSYSVYDEFADNRFMAGRENPVIVYVELDNFHSEEVSDGGYEVKLAQEVDLYTSDGVLVWSQPREQVPDRSRNRRRDFFVRQMIRLPATLGVGEFVLKVRVTDLHAGLVDERSLPLVLVADERLVVDSQK